MPTFRSRTGSEEEPSQLPRIAAIFVIRFDQRVGYTIAWQRCKTGLELSGAVEYKSLPSGLHNVEEDLVYYIHESYAGISAFRSAEADEAERNARFVSVGVLVPRGRGRFGGGWLHAEKLKEFAKALLLNPDGFAELEDWWQKHQVTGAEENTFTSQASLKGDEDGDEDENYDVAAAGMSESTVLAAPGLDTHLPPSHPVLSIIDLLDLLGPLVFPVYRAALLRKRVLFITKPPLLPSCNFVYNLSLLSSIPSDLADDLPTHLAQRINPLFNIGVHDIPTLEQLSKSVSHDPLSGWIACTSDELFTTKPALSDVRIKLPDNLQTGNWPTITSTQLGPLKATQRDFRRYKALRQGLQHLQQSRRHRRPSPSNPITSSTSRSVATTDAPPPSTTPTPILSPDSTILEPPPWAALLYDSFLWWASAGSRTSSADLDAEHEQDRDLFAAAAEAWEACCKDGGEEGDEGNEGAVQVAVVAYFQRMTTGLLEGLGDLVEGDEEDEEEPEQEEDEERQGLVRRGGRHDGARIGGEQGADAGATSGRATTTLETSDLASLGLDAWSQLDRQFLVELSKLYFEREVRVSGARMEWCGVRVC